MKQLHFALTLIAALPSAFPSPLPFQSCDGCIQTATGDSDTEANATLEIEQIPATYVGTTWTGGSRHGTCVLDEEECVMSRRCRIAWLVELTGANSFSYEVCDRVARGNTNPNPWPWDCKDIIQVDAGSRPEIMLLDCDTYAELQVRATGTVPLYGTVTLEATVAAACSKCVP